MSDPTDDARAQLEALAQKGLQLEEERKEQEAIKAKKAKDEERAAQDERETAEQKRAREETNEILKRALGEPPAFFIFFSYALFFQTSAILWLPRTDGPTHWHLLRGSLGFPLALFWLLVFFAGTVALWALIYKSERAAPQRNLKEISETPWKTEGIKEVLASKWDSGQLMVDIKYQETTPEKTLLEGLLVAANLRGASLTAKEEGLALLTRFQELYRSGTNKQGKHWSVYDNRPIYKWTAELTKVLRALHQGYPITSVSYSFHKS